MREAREGSRGHLTVRSRASRGSRAFAGLAVGMAVAIGLAMLPETSAPGSWWPAPALTGAAAQPAVPPEYADLFAALRDRLREIDRYVGARWDGRAHTITLAAEQLAANANRGEVLLNEPSRQGIVLYLDRLQRAGARGVKVAVKYPMLLPDFPRSAEYLALYTRLAEEVRRRDLRLFVQMTTAFREPAFSAVPVGDYYARLTPERYRREKRQMAEIVVRHIRPDYLTIENEPGTQQENTGLRFTVEHVTATVQHVLDGLDRSGVRIGAGIGTWEDVRYVEALARDTTLDYIDMHIYPIQRDFVVDRAVRIAEIAHRHGKRVVLGEAWLYKARDRDLVGGPVAAAPALFARDVYGFWEPLDAEFIAVMVRLGHYLRIDFASFFWSRHFWGYVPYDETTRRLTPVELFRLANQAAVRNMLQEPPVLTLTGITFRRLATE